MVSEEQVDQESVNEQPVEVEEGLVGEIVEEDSVTIESEGDGLQAQLEAANTRADDNWGKLLLAKADVENIRRRTQKDIEKAHRFSVEKFAKDMLPVVDSLEMGLSAVADSSSEEGALKEGMELTLKQLLDSLKKSGVEQLNPIAEVFNAELHQAISIVPSAEHEPNTVMQVFQKGYTLNSRLLRPAMVIVSQPAPPVDAKKIDEQA